MLSPDDWSALLLSLELAAVSTVILLALGVPLAWWLTSTRSRAAIAVNVLVALPLVLPPTVIGFYLLLALGGLSRFTGLDTLAFSFEGLVLGSVVYSLPFVIQPLQAAFAGVPTAIVEAAATLGTRPRDMLFRVALPIGRRGVIAAAVLGFAHTVGEFGVVLMIGGNIPDETRVASIQLYDHVEALDYAAAHELALALVVFSVVLLAAVYWFGRSRRHVSSPVGWSQ